MALGWTPSPDQVKQMRQDFDDLECEQIFMMAKPGRQAELPKRCEEILYSISFFAFEGNDINLE